jgi:hypothetical protein
MDKVPWRVEYELLRSVRVPLSGPDQSYANLGRLHADDQKFFGALVEDWCAFVTMSYEHDLVVGGDFY